MARRLIAPARLPARHRPARLRRLGQGHVAAAQDRPSWLAARHARLGRRLADRPKARARRGHARRSPPPARWRSAWRCCSISPPPARSSCCMWVRSAAEARRLFAYGVTLAGGCAFAFLVFASEANRAPVCDALSPVWLSAMAAAGAVAVLLAWASPRQPARAASASPRSARARWSPAPSPGPGRTASAGSSNPRPSSSGCGCPRCARRCRSGGTARRPRRRPSTLPVAGLIGYAADAVAQPARSGAADPLGGGRRCSPRSPPACSAGRPAPGRPRSCCRSPARRPCLAGRSCWLMGLQDRCWRASAAWSLPS